MKNITTTLKNEVLGKKENLERAKAQLKKEFIGIDTPIDELINSFSYWYFFPELQKKPVIINLWGLTGVGKTSLVNRLIEILQLNKRFYRFNLNDSEWDIRSTLSDIYDNSCDSNFIILLDEFQHVRTITEDGRERNSKHQFIWDLLDDGKIAVLNYPMRTGELSDLIVKLSKLLQIGVCVKNGLVTRNKELFLKEFGEITTYYNGRRRPAKKINDEMLFVPGYYQEVIYELARDRFSLQTEVRDILLSLNGFETINFLRKVMKQALAAKYLDCSKALVFIIGNLDEAYKMTENFDTDISADEFHEESLKISLPEIKDALKVRFRSEQIARLGNNHIIYPALDSKSYYKIIDNELGNLKKEMMIKFGVKLCFDASLREVIYEEGVYPTQGTRPLLSTIHNIVSSQIPRIIYNLLDVSDNIERVKISYNEGNLHFDLISNLTSVRTFSEKIALTLEKLRTSKLDDMQAITAVHESGHALLSIFVMNTLPEVVYSVTTSSDTNGFVYSKFKWEYVSKKEIVNRIAMLLGGFAAEKLIFGDENVTTGAVSDIHKATHFACHMLKNCGMGEVPASFHQEDAMTKYYLFDSDFSVNDQIRRLMNEGLEKAEEVLSRNKRLLVRMSDYLSDNRCLRKEQIQEMLSNTTEKSDSLKIIEDGEHIFYREHLKAMASNLNEKGVNQLLKDKGTGGFSMNREK